MEAHGVEVLVQSGAGEGASIPDEAYRAAGAEFVASAAEVWTRAGMVVKVKEPQASELEHLRPGLTLFTYLHLAAYPKVAAGAVRRRHHRHRLQEFVVRADGALPLLAPMSEVAGRLAVQAGARFLEAPQGGRGVLLGGAPGVQPGTRPSSSALGTWDGTRRGSQRAWRPRSTCSTRTSTGFASMIKL